MIVYIWTAQNRASFPFHPLQNDTILLHIRYTGFKNREKDRQADRQTDDVWMIESSH